MGGESHTSVQVGVTLITALAIGGIAVGATRNSLSGTCPALM